MAFSYAAERRSVAETALRAAGESSKEINHFSG